ncbi:MAG: PAQR family membrane homeostasis protein TrhA [Pseudomarimonas sp.]
MTAEHTVREEVANALTHGLAAAAALAGSSVLITLSALFGDGWQLAGAIVYGVTLLLLYLASTLYHAIPHTTAKARLKVFDHCAIFLLIAGTYTPFALVGLRGPWGWSLLGIVWGLAIIGCVFKLFFTGRFKGLSTLIYIGMGWIALVAIEPSLRLLSTWTLSWVLAGGIAYTLGTLFYMSRRLTYAHAIWHGFVILGSVCHFVAVYSQVADYARVMP